MKASARSGMMLVACSLTLPLRMPRMFSEGSCSISTNFLPPPSGLAMPSSR